MSRKLVVLLLVVLALTGCTSPTEGLRLRIATGFEGGVYNKLGSALATEWATQLGMPRPEVLPTTGSPDNIERLSSGAADIAFSAADVAIDQRGNFSALARIYDDYLHVVVRADGLINSIADLKDKRVAIGARESGVAVIAIRLLSVLNVNSQTVNLGLRDSSTALKEGRIDAFFWSGGLPTDEIVQLGDAASIRLLDLTENMPAIRARYDIYSAAAIPLSVYHTTNSKAVTTLVVPNLLLATDRLPVDAAKVLTQGIFEAQKQLASQSTAANSIDIRTAIETQPIPLHEGALQFYRDRKL
ncbi:TRAP transporter TAXI family solute receptor [Kibdelosporangium banguiense]|uniref:TRAP transporter TAXI family solute receptor n=1 Tax=Kibdelosporangium banguiense TaxID=1365924 RepID=A0ABS4U495_9PSEU|nr:TAXI family TRAP transporter solute-binding subunit [Kibdelosporangium banguiense]MBP2331028.1 TRAP transporter TAXI family solute receptor [Kibdelosporangium banguiense]